VVVAVNISVVIPSNHGHHELLKIVQAVCAQTVQPCEVVIVDSSNEYVGSPQVVAALCENCGIKFVYERSETVLLPGHARNIGLDLASGQIIAFIDVQTIPRTYWLESCLNFLTSNGVYGVWGASCFKAETSFEKLVRDGFYGVYPRKTLPGSIFSRNVFDKTGQFIEWVRAGEDTEWMLRLELLKLNVADPPSALIDYTGLIGSDTKMLVSKWYRNYRASCHLPHFFPQRLFLWLILYPLLTLIAFNWNFLIADWRMDSQLYIGHITKIVALLPILAYIFIRGFWLPMRRGVGVWRLLPFRFISILLVCFVADFVKILVFTLPVRNIEPKRFL
jgi:hypothetical protein